VNEGYYIQKRIIEFAKLKRKSINHCLWVLGADWDEVYNTKRNGSSKLKAIKDYGSGDRSIYDRFNRAELRDWAGHLYKEALKKYHPDLHPENPRLYTEICQELSRAHLRAIEILQGGRRKYY
jgi:hypothetical protein